MAEFQQSWQEFLLLDQPAQEIIHHGAPRPLFPPVLLEDRIDEIFYQDVHALLPPLWTPPLPSRHGKLISYGLTIDLQYFTCRGHPAERQCRYQTNAASTLTETTCFKTIRPPSKLLHSLAFDGRKLSRLQRLKTEDLYSKSLGTSLHNYDNKTHELWSLHPRKHRSDVNRRPDQGY